MRPLLQNSTVQKVPDGEMSELLQIGVDTKPVLSGNTSFCVSPSTQNPRMRGTAPAKFRSLNRMKLGFGGLSATSLNFAVTVQGVGTKVALNAAIVGTTESWFTVP